MTVLFDRGADPAVPGTHVLIIGVGAYPHLGGGGAQLVNKPMGLGQLTSPPISAAAFFEWFRGRKVVPPREHGFHNPTADIATIEVLCSPAQIKCHDGTVLPVDLATVHNIGQAFDRWVTRCQANAANIGTFYFCGHGVETTVHHLLASDFSDPQPFNKAFDITTTVRALERELPNTFYVFVDACRQVPMQVVAQIGATSAPLRYADLDRATVNQSHYFLRATGEGQSAFADPGQVSRFTQVLIQSLSGYAGKKKIGQALWCVGSAELTNSIQGLLDIANVGKDEKQSIDPKGLTRAPLHYGTAAPLVKVGLDLIPQDRRNGYSLHLDRDGNSMQYPATNCPWNTEVPCGVYDIMARKANSADISYPNELLDPPSFAHTFDLDA